MYQQYKVTVLKHNKLWCEVIINQRDSASTLNDINARFPRSQGFTCSIYKKTGENRILSASDQGIKVLAIEEKYAEMGNVFSDELNNLIADSEHA